MITLTLPLPPSTNNLWKRTTYGMRLSDAAKAYKQEVWTLCYEAGLAPISGHVRLEIDVYLPRANADLSNRVKCLEDALEGYAYHNDKQVYESTQRKFIDKANPRVVVRISAL